MSDRSMGQGFRAWHALVLMLTILAGWVIGLSPSLAAESPNASIPIVIQGKIFALKTGLSWDSVKKQLSTLFADEPSVDTTERIQYDKVLVPDQAPVSFVFDFDGKGNLINLTIDAYTKEQNPTVTRLVVWLGANVGKPKVHEGQRDWHYAGWTIVHRFGGDGEDSSFSVECSLLNAK
ncbi:hypothetical protein [Lamprocystis purpurea]|uniref:hypothetical protein n=1 Tax=Lamprocystis purpurea TaxID=61598 RepID=UPI0012F7A904|nr:hypothetical protein [Lamprocystis purpurea]